MLHSLLYDCVRHLLPFGLGGAINTAEEEDYKVIKFITTVSVEQSLAWPGSAEYTLQLPYIQLLVMNNGFNAIMIYWGPGFLYDMGFGGSHVLSSYHHGRPS